MLVGPRPGLPDTFTMTDCEGYHQPGHVMTIARVGDVYDDIHPEPLARLADALGVSSFIAFAVFVVVTIRQGVPVGIDRVRSRSRRKR